MDNKITCKYLFSDDYNPKYVNGAYGGVNARGEMIFHFYLERDALPNAMSFSTDENSPFFGEEIKGDRDPEDHESSFVRFIENGIVMNYEDAKEFHAFLGNQIKVYERLNTKEAE